jgi:hypothetical protein
MPKTNIPKRKPLSKKLRFEVFKRDGFACAYCGKTPPEITLEIDHIEPVSSGGTNDPMNLLTACFDCNRGKKNIPLDKIPAKLSDNLEILKEKEEQIKEYRKFVNLIKRRRLRDANKVNDIYKSFFPEWTLNPDFIKDRICKFIELLPLDQVEDAMRLACKKMNDKDQTINYFCGICWNKIRGIKPPNSY